ncbi:Abi family protein [Butyrivibrio sp. INlla14]|uniref:Abi family protein n=1 Tax=Butyrivibrio sp. INlla14 TaxID=1520808 RepID=UPI0008769B49|nr:Abi family protein [Butyrivibrio sp. INlla14]SCX96732.1 Abortive infection bacteriophage resistance protein [Butyrivibrio sp. INlla14]
MNTKDFKNIEEQLSELKKKGLIISDEDIAKSFLKQVSYYRFSGYFIPFQQSDKTFFPGISFEQLQNIYEFDCELRNLITGAIDTVETYLKTQIAYYHAEKYGPEGYMDANNFNKNHDDSNFKKRVNACIKENARSLVVKHHQLKYQGHFPLWVMVDYFSMGMLSYFYKDLLNHDKADIAQNLYGTTYQSMESWLRCLTDLRNKCAHYSRLYYWIFPALPKLPQNSKYVPTRRLFTQLYTLKLLYPDHDRWNNDFVKPLIKLLKKYKPYISNKHLDFPYRWKSILKY